MRLGSRGWTIRLHHRIGVAIAAPGTAHRFLLTVAERIADAPRKRAVPIFLKLGEVAVGRSHPFVRIVV
jgi:hypothetical protein